MPYIIQVDTQDRLLEILKIVVPAVIGLVGVFSGIFLKERLDRRSQKRKTKTLRALILHALLVVEEHLNDFIMARIAEGDIRAGVSAIKGLKNIASCDIYTPRLAELSEKEAVKIRIAYAIIDSAVNYYSDYGFNPEEDDFSVELYKKEADFWTREIQTTTEDAISSIRRYYKPWYRKKRRKIKGDE